MKTVNLVLAGLFVLFALLNLNDVDPTQWVLYYGLIAAACALAAFGRFNKWLVLLLGLYSIIQVGILLPEFINWVKMDMPTITGEMKATEPHVEYTREFLGLFIGLGAMLWLWFKH